METPWNRARKLRTVLQEERLNTLPGGRKGVNSGRFWRWPRDGRIFDFLVEARTNEKPGAKSATINKAEWLTLKREALSQPGGMLPAMQITMDEVDLIVIDLKDFSGMISDLMAAKPDK
jgi:hypothetical protein